MTLADLLLADFEQEAQATRAVLAAIPEEHLGWKPHDKSMTVAQLAGHIAETPAWCRGMLEAEMDFASEEAKAWVPFVPTSVAQLLEHLEESHAAFREAVSGREDTFLEETWTMRQGETVFMQAPRHAAMRSIALRHQAHHRGQLTVYLRLLDVPVPPTYGPTADVAEFAAV